MFQSTHSPSPSLRDPPVVISLVLLVAPYMALAWWLCHSGRPSRLAGFLLAVSLTWVVLAAITRGWRRFLLLQCPLFVLSVAFAAYTLSFGNPPGYSLAAVLATSTPPEYLGFFSIWYGQRLLLAVVPLCALYLWAAWRVPDLPIAAKGPTRLRTALLAVIGAVGLFAALHPDALIDGLASDPLVGTVFFATGPLKQTRAALAGRGFNKTHYGASRQGAEELHVLVIGESGRRDSWSVYGYGRSTTPYLDSIRHELILFSDAVTDANMTAYAVPILLTGMEPETYDLSAVRGNLVDLAAEAGYSTSWLSNQDVGIAALVGIAAQQTYYTNRLMPYFGGLDSVDGSLLPAFDAQIKGRSSSRFIAIHSMGSHWEYYHRYPREFQRYGSAGGLSFISAFSNRPDSGVIDAYDNSVLYTDWFLHQIIDSLRSLEIPATVTYIADHGEDLYTLDGSSGHGFATFTPHQFDVPAFVWANSAYRETHPDKIAALQANAGKEIRTHDVFYSLADIMGIRWPGAKAHGSFASADFVPDTGGKVLAGGKLVDPQVSQ